MRIAISLIPLLFLAISGLSQTNWAESFGGNTTDEALSVAVDGSGNTYTTGFFTGSCNFGVNSVVSQGVTDVYIVKTNSNGVVQWVASGGGSSVDRGLDVEVDASGNVYVTGYYTGSATFGATTITAAGGQDVFVAKYTSAGALDWVFSAGGTGSEQGNGIAVDGGGNVIVTGQFQGDATFGATTLTSMINSGTGLNSIDVFTLKLTSTGAVTWVEQGSAKSTDRGLDVATDALGNIYITGQFSDSITFDVLHPNLISNAIFVVKYNALGVEQWYRKIGASVSIAYGITVSGSSLFLTGDFQGSLIFYGSPNNILNNSYSKKIFVGKYDLSGNYQASTALGSDNILSSRDITADGLGGCYITGNFECSFSELTAFYEPSNFRSVGYQDIFVAKFSSTLGFIYATQYGGPKNDIVGGIDISTVDQPVIAGTYNHSFNLPSTPTWLGYGTTVFSGAPSTYCGDPNYNRYMKFTSLGASDAFLAAPVDTSRSLYDFVTHPGGPCTKDLIPVHIHGTTYDTLNPVDSIFSCNGTSIRFNSFTSSTVGPIINFQWFNGNILDTAVGVFATDWYWIDISTEDGCLSSEDSIHVTISPAGTLTISDDVIINQNATLPITIHICPPDTIELTGGGFAGMDSVEWISSETFTQIDSVTIDVYSGGTYFFTAVDTFGCTKNVLIQIIEDQIITLDSIVPQIQFTLDTDNNDTITICDNEFTKIWVYDTITNPLGLDIPMLLASYTWLITPDSLSSTSYFVNYSPDSSGWVYFDVDILISYDNECGGDTLEFNVVDSIYFDVVLSPAVTLNILSSTGSLPPFICPGDTIELTANTNGVHSWLPQIFAGAPTDTTIQVWLPGIYKVITTLTDTATGCVSNSLVQTEVFFKPIPVINTSSFIICPNDSVELSVTIPGTYEWYGPNGAINQDTNSIFVQEPGFYYVVVNDTDNCVLVSNSIELVQYTTPGMTASPNAHLCPGDPGVLLQVETVNTNGITWLSPLSGTAVAQFVTSPGTYSAEVTGCGITVTVSITVTGSTPNSSINPLTPTTLCPGDTFVLAANPGMTGYLWLPSLSLDSAIQTTVPGPVTLIATDQFGCNDTSSVLLSNHPLPNPPTITNTVSCYGDPVTMFASGTGNTTWLDSSMTVLSTGNSFTTQANFGPITYWVYLTHLITGCISDTIPVTVTIDPIYLGINVSSNSPVCVGNNIQFSTQVVPGGSYSWDGPNGYSSFNPNPVISNTTLADSGYYVVTVFNGLCSSPGDSVFVTMIPKPPTPVVDFTSPVCAGDSILFSVTPTPGETYTWSGPGYAAFGPSNFIYPATAANTGFYNVYATANGCNSALAPFQVTIKPTPSPVVVSNAPICEGDTLLFSLSIDSGSVFSWNDPNGVIGTNPVLVIPNAQASPAGYYFLEASLNNCPIEPLPLGAIVYSYPDFDLGDTIVVCEDSMVSYILSNSYTSYLWHDGSDDNTYLSDGSEDYVAVTVTNGVCLRSDTAFLKYFNCNLTIPNVFTPNGDGINDLFTIESEGALELEVDIYNRWGQLIGKMHGVGSGWDGTHYLTGKRMSEGVYYYLARITKHSGQIEERAGFLHLLAED